MNDRMKHILCWSTVILFSAFLISLAANIWLYRTKEHRTITETVHVTFVDTIPYYIPTPRDSVVVRYVTETLPANPGRDTSATFKDSCDVIIPITQKVYKDKEYEAYVSGYKPNLDSIFVYPRNEITTITNHVKQKPKRWSVGIQLGYGVNLKGAPDFRPYFGIGLTYNIFSF